jgi:tetratricopeptide (TPR) repeat protein
MTCSHCGRDTPTVSGRCTSCGAVLDGVVLFDGSTASGATVLGGRADETRLGAAAPEPARPSGAGVPDETRLSAASSPDETRLAVPSATGPRPDTPAEPIAVGLPFGTRYQVIRELGIGGMGAVYQAWDQELSVVVALKVIRPEVAANPEAARMLERRFKQELLLARQVTHKNVVRIHDLGEINGVKYITMPFIEGEELGTILKREGKLPVRQVLRVARTMASGLAAAHAAGVVHRDLKPANIMIDADGEAMIMDFGIARSTGAYAKSGDAEPRGGMPSIAGGHTLVGMIVGTVEYMAPEQAKAQPVDHRADIYAFGLILYDLLVGRARQTRAESALAELTSRTMAPPPSARSIDPEIPEHVDQIITRCIQPDAAARYQTTPELVADLERLDADGNLLPIVRRLTWRMVAGVATLFVATLGTTWWLARGPAVPVQHDPISVVIADFQNNTGDMTFDRVLEPTLKRALEDATFINAYDRTGMGALGVRPPEKLDEAAARDIALKQGVGVVLSGSLDRQDDRYEISIKAIQSVTGNVITTAKGRASDKNQILAAGSKLMVTVRKALGDDTSDAAQMYAVNSVSASSLEVMRHYVAGREAAAGNNFEEARGHFLKAIEVDPKFGLGYLNLSIMSQNLGNLQEAEKHIQRAVSLLAGMTERERYGVRGRLYQLTGDYQQCVKEFGEMVGRYAADANSRLILAQCSSFLRKLPNAVNETRQLVKLLPKRPVYRVNLALYESYAGNFQAGEQEAREVLKLGSTQWGLFSLAFAQIGQGQLRQAAETYQELAKVNAQGASQAASGLGDLAVAEGRFSDAVRILEKGAQADLAANNADPAAAKFTSLAHAHLLLRQNRQAIAAADKALANSKAVKTRFLAARVLIAAGETARAQKLAAELASEPQAEPQAYAKIIEGGAAMTNGNPQQAIKALGEANTLLDTWIGHFDLGRAYFEAALQGTKGTGLRALDDFAKADSEFDRCVKRRGEALSLLLDEEPTYGYFPPAYYYQGRVREELKTEGFADSYRAYLTIRGQSTEDRLLADARRRAGS